MRLTILKLQLQLLWSTGAPAACKDQSVSPLHLFGFMGDASLPLMDTYFEGSLEAYLHSHVKEIQTCMDSLYPFGLEKREHLNTLLDLVAENKKDEFIKVYCDEHSTY